MTRIMETGIPATLEQDHGQGPTISQTYTVGGSWVLNTPHTIRKYAIHEFMQAYCVCKKRLREDPSFKHFKMHYHSKKALWQTISMPKRMWASNNEDKRRTKKKENKFSGVLDSDCLKILQPLLREILNDFKVTCTSLGHFYLCIPQPLK